MCTWEQERQGTPAITASRQLEQFVFKYSDANVATTPLSSRIVSPT